MVVKLELFIGACLLVALEKEAVIDGLIAGNNGVEKIKIVNQSGVEKWAVVPTGLVDSAGFEANNFRGDVPAKTSIAEYFRVESADVAAALSWMQSTFPTIYNDLVNNHAAQERFCALTKKKQNEQEPGALLDWESLPLSNELQILSLNFALQTVLEELVDGATIESLNLKDDGTPKISEVGYKEFLKALVSIPWNEANMTAQEIAALNDILDFVTVDEYQPEQPINSGGLTADELITQLSV